MKKTFIIIAALCAFCAGLRADSVKVKNSQLRDLAEALVELDGYSRVIDQGKDTPQKEVHLSYDFSGSTRFAIAHDISALTAAFDILDKARVAIIKQVTNGGTSIDAKDAAALTKFYAIYAEVWNKEETLQLDRFTPADLRADINPLPPTLLVRLAPVINYDAKK